MRLFRRGKKFTALVLVATAAGMVGLSFAAVPLYQVFCRVTGYGGTTQVARAAPEVVAGRVITVRFNTDLAAGLDWRFKPMQRAVEVHPGESHLAFFEATNRSDRPILAQASYNVTPDKAGRYFNKIECFCFTKQYLEPGARDELAVSFFIDPEIVNDRNLADLGTITLSYTFFDLGPEALDAYLAESGRLASRAGEAGAAAALD